MKRVLVLDDDVAIAELMRVVLEDAGFTTIAVTAANDLPNGSIVCVVTDLMSVARYSLDAARDWIARLHERYPAVPIILVTAHGEAARDKASLAVQHVIVKPFDIDQLPAAVRALTAR